jgi:hypothetical protein
MRELEIGDYKKAEALGPIEETKSFCVFALSEAAKRQPYVPTHGSGNVDSITRL